MPKDNSELEEIVGLFRNESKAGKVYYGGKTKDGEEVVMFRNDYWEEGKNRPYFRLYKRTGDRDSGSSSKTIED
jgi:hypothetical protein